MKHVLNMMQWLKKGEGREAFSREEFGQVPWMIEMGYQTPELEQLLIEAGPHVLDYFHIEQSKHHECWAYHIPEIVAGQFPLERLPEHVRELARGLYYQK